MIFNKICLNSFPKMFGDAAVYGKFSYDSLPPRIFLTIPNLMAG